MILPLLVFPGQTATGQAFTLKGVPLGQTVALLTNGILASKDLLGQNSTQVEVTLTEGKWSAGQHS